MFQKSRTATYLFSLFILLVVILGFSGCNLVSTPTLEATVVAPIPVATIVTHPNLTEVPAGDQIAISAKTTGVNLQIRWSVNRGGLSNTEGPSTIYTAPNEPGPDTVDVIVTSNGSGTTTNTVAFTVMAASTVTPTNIPPVTPSPSPSSPNSDVGVIELNPADFVAQDGDRDGIKEELILDTRFGAIPDLPIQDGVNLSDYDLEFTFQGGDGKEVQLWYKSQDWTNVYSFPSTITSGRPIRYNPLTDGRNVDEFDDFTHIYAIGAKVFGGIEEIRIVSARLIPRSTSSSELGTATGAPSVTPTTRPIVGMSNENQLPPIIEGEFVTRQGSTLMLGENQFFFVGTNAYFLQPEMAYGNSAGVIETLDTMVALGMPVVRIWAFNDNDPTTDPAAIQSEPGVYREESLVALDQVIAEAKKRNIRLILTLVNFWSDYGGVKRYLQWYQAQCNCEASISDFYTNETIKRWYKDYVHTLLTRTNTITGIKYKDEPAILAWELGNELRNPGGDPNDLLAWQEEMSAYIKSLAPNHLVADGGEGFDDAPKLYPNLSNTYAVRGDEGASYHRLVNMENFDMVSYHLYPSKWGLNDKSDVETWIRVHEELAQQAGKVAYLGEVGVMGTDAHRATTLDGWLTTALTDNQSAGALVWGLAYQNRPDYDTFTVYCPVQVETCAVLRDQASNLTFSMHHFR